MSDVLDRLQRRVIEMSDEEIREALRSEDELREDALEIYREEAIRRGLSMAEEPETEEPAPTTGTGESRGDHEEGPAPSLARRGVENDSGEFTAADREVECQHCGGRKFIEHEVALPVRGAQGSVTAMPVTVLHCIDCGSLLWFGEPMT